LDEEKDRLGVCVWGLDAVLLDDVASSGCLDGNDFGSGSGGRPFSTKKLSEIIQK
jgi:hypothetical protein